jgi:hypothetical protein
MRKREDERSLNVKRKNGRCLRSSKSSELEPVADSRLKNRHMIHILGGVIMQCILSSECCCRFGSSG